MSNFDALLDELGEEFGLTKALTAAGRSNVAAIADEDDEIDPADRAILKAFRQMAAVIHAQGRAINDLRSRVGLGGSQVIAKALVSGSRISGEEFMAKALSAQTAGRITGLQVSIAEAHINNGKAPPKDIVRAVLG